MTTSSKNAVTLQQLVDHANHTNNKALSRHLAKVITHSEPSDSVADIAFQALRLDSRQVDNDDVFILLKSQTPNAQSSRNYLYQAAKSAAFILSEIDPLSLLSDPNLSNGNLSSDDALSSAATAEQRLLALSCPIIHVPDIRDFLGSLIQAYLQYQQPVTLPTVVAVTGTNGKTTISQLAAQLSQLAGKSSAVMGTAGNGKLGALTQASHTTGDALAVQQFLYQMGREQADTVVLEASSHGLDQQRLQGVPIQVAIYTNLSRDHLDYHTDMNDYVAAKAKLFDKTHFPALTHAIINLDDEYAKIMLDKAQASGLVIWTYSLQANSEATLVATDIRPSLEGAKITLRCQFEHESFDKPPQYVNIVSPLLGRFNVANLLAAIGAAVALGIDMERIAALLPSLQGAIGRMQRVPSTEGSFIVDYAHTPDALSQVLQSLKPHCKGKLWAVFGCGGDRDAGKRPLMAQAGLADADNVILTADNPRTEDPLRILQDMQAGMSAEQYQRTHIEPSRQRAIEYAVSGAHSDDIVVIAGKGHETYQEINGVRHDFDDRVILQQALQHAGRA